MLQNDEKRYKITKVQKINESIDNAKQNASLYAYFAAIYAITSSWLCINAVNYDNPVKLIIGGGIGALSICKMVTCANIHKEINDLKRTRDELLQNEEKEVETKRTR